ncbi:MAG: hypothetical protein ACO289_05895 [Prochlorococcaceae cyanobacterium]
MANRLSWWWIVALALLLLAPGPASRLLFDVVGGVTLLIVALPVALGGVGLLAWFLLQRRLRTCAACGFRSVGSDVCPACGTVFSVVGAQGSASAGQVSDTSFDARDLTIDVTATDVDKDASGKQDA